MAVRPDTIYRLHLHSGKYVSSILGKEKAQTSDKVPKLPVPTPTYKKNAEIQKHMHIDSNRTSLLLWWHMFVQKNLFLTNFIFGLRKLLPDERMHLFQHRNLFWEGKEENRPSVAKEF